MEIYVDELPKSCSVCACGVEDEMCCCWCMAFEDDFHHYIHSEDFETKRLHSCPLQSLADHTKQVRKEVLGELMNMLGDRAELIDCGGVAEFMFTTYDLTMCVEEILREEKGAKNERN